MFGRRNLYNEMYVKCEKNVSTSSHITYLA